MRLLLSPAQTQILPSDTLCRGSIVFVHARTSHTVAGTASAYQAFACTEFPVDRHSDDPICRAYDNERSECRLHRRQRQEPCEFLIVKRIRHLLRVLSDYHMKSRLSTLFVILFLIGFRSQPVEARQGPHGVVSDTITVNLTSAIRRSLRVSPEVGVEEADLSRANAVRRFAKAHRYLAEFEATSAHSTSPGLDNPNGTPKGELYLDPQVRNDWNNLNAFNMLEIKAVQPIFTWGEVSGNITAARFGAHAQEEAVRAKELEVAARTGEMYYGLLLTEALSRLTREAGDNVDKAIKEIERLLDDGAEGVDDADLFQVQITQQEFNKRVVEVEQKHLTAVAALSRQMFLSEGQTLVTQETLLSAIPIDLHPLEYYMQQALTNRPILAQVAAGYRAREALVTVARSDLFPKLFLAASAKYSAAPERFRQRNPFVGDPFLSRGLQIGFGFRQKLNFNQTRAKVEQARSEESKMRFQADAARQLVLFEVEEAYRNVLITRAAVGAQSKALKLSKEWLRTEQVNFEYDLGDTENLVKAVQSNLELQAANYQAIHDFNRSVIRLLKATGILPRLVESGTFVE